MRNLEFSTYVFLELNRKQIANFCDVIDLQKRLFALMLPQLHNYNHIFSGDAFIRKKLETWNVLHACRTALSLGCFVFATYRLPKGPN